MSMLRNSTVNQLDRIEKDIKKQGGKLDLTVPSDHTSANGMWIHDPFEENRKGKRKIATIDDYMTIDIPESNKVLKFADFNKINESVEDDIKNEIESSVYDMVNHEDDRELADQVIADILYTFDKYCGKNNL